jgi:tripartite-type tricarboxylate transporter receptor subunit TctC
MATRRCSPTPASWCSTRLIHAKDPYDRSRISRRVDPRHLGERIMIHPSVPAKTLKEFIAYAKANANKLSYGSAGAAR